MTNPESVVVVARWRVPEESLDEVLADIAELRPQVLAEPGCLGYEAFQAVGEPTSLVLVERYRDLAALDAHVNSDHYQQIVGGRIRPLLLDRQVEILHPHEG